MKQAMELTILGKAGKSVLKKLSKRYFVSRRRRWLFLDYAEMDIPLNSSFDVLLRGDNKALIPAFYHVKVVRCLDQFGNELDFIPEGYKTICRLEFRPKVPQVIEQLPSLETWKSNPAHITVANHANVQLAFPGTYQADISLLAYLIILEDTAKHIQSMSDLHNSLVNKYKMNNSQVDRVIGAFMQMGKIKRTSNNDIELLSTI
jgi:hypothetical protein